MNPTLDAVLRSWPWDPWLLLGLAATGFIYWRGWRYLHRREPQRWHGGKLAAFLGGLAAIYLALASPIEPFSYFFLQVHMLQHLLLMMAAPPLLWLGAPLFPLLRGLPAGLRMHWVAPWLRSPVVGGAFSWLTRPTPALILYVAVTWVWHVPSLYDLAMSSDGWHYLQHLCFLLAALVFWYPVVRPYPSRPRWPLWWLLPYLLVADVQNTVLSALLTFSDRVLYSHYALAPRLGTMTALEDQAAAGVLMWVPGSVAFLGPFFWIGLHFFLGATTTSRTSMPRPGPNRISLPLVPSGQVSGHADLLNVPLLGRFLKWRQGRLVMQLFMFFLAGLVIVDGLLGPQVSPINLAGVLPWIHWRGLLILGLLVLGNVFCMACPFLLPRALARRFRPAVRAWPTWLRNKWLAVGLLIGFLWSYEVFSLWDSPWLTAWIVLAYFATAFAVDSVFHGAAFCKFVCPIGQFNFVQSLVSPLEIKVRDTAICAACTTKDCIRGRDGIPGCELNLYQPRKASNMDCTFCLDCVHACPHDNIGILATTPGAELWRDPQRSGIGRWSQRLDLAALVAILVFGAFVNAALMTGPVVAWQDIFTAALGGQTPFLAQTTFLLVGLVLGPLLVIGCAACVSRWWGGLKQPVSRVAARFCYALVPLGFAMWLTHYSFHLVTSYATAAPAAQRFLGDLGVPFLGDPAWSCSCCVPAASWLLKAEILALDCGFLLSLYVGYRIAQTQGTSTGQALKAFAPWATLIGLLFMAGLWIIFQPMQMRGTMPM